jgi:hypothetical protein
VFEANLFYFELQGNEWFFWQKLKDRGCDALVAKMPAGIGGLGLMGDILSVIGEMKGQRMLQFSITLQPPTEVIFEKFIEVGVTEQTITEFMIRVMQIESGDIFEVEKQATKYFLISALSRQEREQFKNSAQPRLVTADRIRTFAVFGKDFQPEQADFRKYTF